MAPAEIASWLNSWRSSESTAAPSPRRTSTARSPVRGRSKLFMCYRSTSFGGGRLRDGATFLGSQPHVARRHNGRNGVLVDHLTDAVLQQNDELIERVDLALQLDAVHEIDRDRDPLLA